MFKRIVKGEPHYLTKKRNKSILFTIIYFAISLGIILLGFIMTGTKRNYLTVIGILGCLPSCKSAVNSIMLCLSKGCSENYIDRLEQIKGRLLLMYDMYFTTYKKNFSISNMVVDDGVIIAFSEDKDISAAEFSEHIKTMLKSASLKAQTITLVADFSKYEDMLIALNNKENTEMHNNDEDIRIALYEISL